MTSKYILIDEEHNIYQCTECGHTVTFEADGPYENSVDYCPGCGRKIIHELPFRCECGYEGEPAHIVGIEPVTPDISRSVPYPGLVCCPECRAVKFVGEIYEQG